MKAILPMHHSHTWIEVDLSAVKANYLQALKLAARDSVVTCVLKSNAYGHGAVPVAKALAEAGCRHFAVSCAREALMLRAHGIGGEILVMGVSEAAYLPALSKANITIALQSWAEGGQIAEKGCSIKIHLKVDTGFHRLGFPADDAGIAQMAEVAGLAGIQVCGLFSHLSLVDAAHDRAQLDALLRVRDALLSLGVDVRDTHICDSIGMVRYPEFHLSRVRIGAFLYGVRPYKSEAMPFECRQTLSFKSTVTAIHLAHAGDYVGYDDKAPLARDTLIATLPVGYGDGYPRRMSQRAHVLINGKPAKVISIVCMDQMMVDITEHPKVSCGDEATLIGGGIDYQVLSEWAGTNRNDIITSLSARPQRLYYMDQKLVSAEDRLLEHTEVY